MKKRKIEDVKKDLQHSLDRLNEVKEKGNDALSDYDIKMGYDAEFYLVICPILQGHVNYYQKELKGFEPQIGDQLEIF